MPKAPFTARTPGGKLARPCLAFRGAAGRVLLFVVAGLVAPACDSGTPAPERPAETGADTGARLADPGPLVVFLGDSRTAGLGLAQDEAYPARVRELAAAAGRPLRVGNAGVSGDTSAGGLARVSWLVAQRPAVVVVALGANDGLRGLSTEALEKNLREIVAQIREGGARVLLAGMHMPPNYGPEYSAKFHAAYEKVAEDLDVPFLPFLLEGVGGVRELNQDDGIHPNAAGQRKLAETVWEELEPLLPEP